MEVNKTRLYEFMDGTVQFSIPVYQRSYAWNEEQCEQLWQDVANSVKKGPKLGGGHFIGSIVCISNGANNPSSVREYQIVDGQQRLTTVSLMLLAIANAGQESGISDADRGKIKNRFLMNRDEDGDRKYKLVMTERDREAMFALVDGKRPKTRSLIETNYDFFCEKISKGGIDPIGIRDGILNLTIVDIALDRSDDPQLIFESLNSTGRGLRDADHIRNYVLMNLEPDQQTEIYKSHWSPMESKFDKVNPSEFDNFIKDYLTLKSGSNINKDDVYQEFKYLVQGASSKRSLVEDIRHFADLYLLLVSSAEQDPVLRQKVQDMQALHNRTSYPFLLEVYHDYAEGRITRNEMAGVLSLVESYVVRHTVCSLPSNSFNKMFPRLASEIDKENYLESLKVQFVKKSGNLRFSNDDEFEKALASRPMHNKRMLRHMLNKLENHGHKEIADVSGASIEHIMPKRLGDQWKRDLGPDWRRIHDEYLHTLGNLTLTGYNPELGNRPFVEKRDMSGGYGQSHLHLNKALAGTEKWDEARIQSRAKDLARRACEIWRYPALPSGILARCSPDDDQDEDDEDDRATPMWAERVGAASPGNRRAVEALKSEILSKFECVAEPHGRYLYFYARRPLNRKSLFAVMSCGIHTARINFRIDPDSFTEGGVVKVAGWFFPKGTERRMSVEADSIGEITRILKHAHDATGA